MGRERGNNVFNISQLTTEDCFDKVPIVKYELQMISIIDLIDDSTPLCKCIAHDGDKHVEQVDHDDECCYSVNGEENISLRCFTQSE